MTALDELNEIKELVNNDKHFKYKNIVNFNCESIEKSLKALEIINKKLVDVFKLYNCKTVEEYNQAQYRDCMLTEEEYETIKDVLE